MYSTGGITKPLLQATDPPHQNQREEILYLQVLQATKQLFSVSFSVFNVVSVSHGHCCAASL